MYLQRNPPRSPKKHIPLILQIIPSRIKLGYLHSLISPHHLCGANGSYSRYVVQAAKNMNVPEDHSRATILTCEKIQHYFKMFDGERNAPKSGIVKLICFPLILLSIKIIIPLVNSLHRFSTRYKDQEHYNCIVSYRVANRQANPSNAITIAFKHKNYKVENEKRQS